MPTPEKFAFGPDLEIRILAALSSVRHFLTQFDTMLDPRLFLLKKHELWAKAAFAIGKRHAMPHPDIVRYAATQMCGGVGFEDVFPADIDAVHAVVRPVCAEDLSAMVEYTREFVQRRAFIALALEARTLTDVAAYKVKLQRVLKLGENGHGHAQCAEDYARLVQDADLRLEQRRVGQHDPYIPTGIERVDHMLAGGLRAARFGLVVAPTRGGKSTILSNCGAGAFVRGLKVAHFSHENETSECIDKYHTILAGVPTLELRFYEPLVRERLALAQRAGGDLRIQFWARGHATVESYGAKLAEWREQDGFVPDLVISDYVDLLKNPAGVTEKRHQLASKVADLFGFAHERKIATWSALQANRDACDSAYVGLDNVGECWEAAGIADVVLTVAATEAMEQQGRVRISKKKDRGRPDGQSEEFTFHKLLQRFE